MLMDAQFGRFSLDSVYSGFTHVLAYPSVVHAAKMQIITVRSAGRSSPQIEFCDFNKFNLIIR